MKRLIPLAMLVGVLACGDTRELPTSPSAIVGGTDAVGATAPAGEPAWIQRPVTFGMVQGLVAFPPRSEPNGFYQDLQALYRDALRRSPTVTYVDAEGQNVWLTEYFRFYLNGCSHEEASSRTLTEIATGATLATCGSETLVFPPRNLPNEFQSRLQATYRDVLRRPATATYVDSEGANVWLAQYLRFRVVGGCDHGAAEGRVFAEIMGGGVQPDCVAPTAPGVGAIDVSGTWDVRFVGRIVQRNDGGPVGGSQFDSYVLVLQQSGTNVTGSMIYEQGTADEFRLPVTGTLTGARLQYGFDASFGPCAVTIRADAAVAASSRQFSGSSTQATCEGRAEGTVTANKR